MMEKNILPSLAAGPNLGATNLDFQVEQYIYKRKCDDAYIEPGLSWLMIPALTANLLSQRQLNLKPACHCSGNTDSSQCYVNFMQQGS
ncbi:40S ribosomal protein SA, partial [Galemys pyrenaicus]